MVLGAMRNSALLLCLFAFVGYFVKAGGSEFRSPSLHHHDQVSDDHHHHFHRELSSDDSSEERQSSDDSSEEESLSPALYDYQVLNKSGNPSLQGAGDTGAEVTDSSAANTSQASPTEVVTARDETQATNDNQGSQTGMRGDTAGDNTASLTSSNSNYFSMNIFQGSQSETRGDSAGDDQASLTSPLSSFFSMMSTSRSISSETSEGQGIAREDGLSFYFPFKVDGADGEEEDDNFCNTPHPSEEELQRDAAMMQVHRESQRGRQLATPCNGCIVIDMYVHIITDGLLGTVTDEAIALQMEVLNNVFDGSPFRFVHKKTTRTSDSSLFYLDQSFGNFIPSMQSALGSRLREGGDRRTLNFYTVKLRPRGLGVATFPSGFVGIKDGVFVDYCSLPGGTCPPYNTGEIPAHEVGHWLGLLHPFEGGCNDKFGDFVSDTPAQASSIFSCSNPSENSCPDLPGSDPLDNYMGYSVQCFNRLTTGQWERMHDQWYIYRDNTGACATDEGVFSAEIKLDSNPEENYWRLYHDDGSLITMSEFGASEAGVEQNVNLCLPYDSPIFFGLADDKGNGLRGSRDSFLRVFFDGKPLRSGREFGQWAGAAFTMVSIAGCPLGEGMVVVELLLDDYPEDISWRVQDELGNIVYQEKEYKLKGDVTLYKNASVRREMCLPSGSYSFLIADSYGNGLSENSQPGQPFFRVTSGDQMVIDEKNFVGESQEVALSVTAETSAPTNAPITPTAKPSTFPTGKPTIEPTTLPTNRPTLSPTEGPSKRPTPTPTGEPSSRPSLQPTERPTPRPSQKPTSLPTGTPTERPSSPPTDLPTGQPTDQPTEAPTVRPTMAPTLEPTTAHPTGGPTPMPTPAPTDVPTGQPTDQPTEAPTVRPTMAPTPEPTTAHPTGGPTPMPTPAPTDAPTGQPTDQPTEAPTVRPTMAPTPEPTMAHPTGGPTPMPTPAPTDAPTDQPTEAPTVRPTMAPTPEPTTAHPTGGPTPMPTPVPTDVPTDQPTGQPTEAPTVRPTMAPTLKPTTAHPTGGPTPMPIPVPTNEPTAQPSARPTPSPTPKPTGGPTMTPTSQPTGEPTNRPTSSPTNQPTDQQINLVVSKPETPKPSTIPTAAPSVCADLMTEKYYYRASILVPSIKCESTEDLHQMGQTIKDHFTIPYSVIDTSGGRIEDSDVCVDTMDTAPCTFQRGLGTWESGGVCGHTYPDPSCSRSRVPPRRLSSSSDGSSSDGSSSDDGSGFGGGSGSGDGGYSGSGDSIDIDSSDYPYDAEFLKDFIKRTKAEVSSYFENRQKVEEIHAQIKTQTAQFEAKMEARTKQYESMLDDKKKEMKEEQVQEEEDLQATKASFATETDFLNAQAELEEKWEDKWDSFEAELVSLEQEYESDVEFLQVEFQKDVETLVSGLANLTAQKKVEESAAKEHLEKAQSVLKPDDFLNFFPVGSRLAIYEQEIESVLAEELWKKFGGACFSSMPIIDVFLAEVYSRTEAMVEVGRCGAV